MENKDAVQSQMVNAMPRDQMRIAQEAAGTAAAGCNRFL